MITYVTGCSGTGKADLADLLRDRGADVVELNEHDSGMPKGGHIDWLHWVAAEHLVDHAGAPDDVNRIVVGTMSPFRLIDSLTWRSHGADGAVRFVLIDAPWADIKATLTQRLVDGGASPEEVEEQVENDRRLQRALHYQVNAVVGGTCWEGGLGELATWLSVA